MKVLPMIAFEYSNSLELKVNMTKPSHNSQWSLLYKCWYKISKPETWYK